MIYGRVICPVQTRETGGGGGVRFTIGAGRGTEVHTSTVLNGLAVLEEEVSVHPLPSHKSQARVARSAPKFPVAAQHLLFSLRRRLLSSRLQYRTTHPGFHRLAPARSSVCTHSILSCPSLASDNQSCPSLAAATLFMLPHLPRRNARAARSFA